MWREGQRCWAALARDDKAAMQKGRFARVAEEVHTVYMQDK